jgi:hypothetical protein
MSRTPSPRLAASSSRPIARLLFSAAVALAAAVPMPAQESRPLAPAPRGPEVVVPAYPNATCPIMGKPASLKLFVDTAEFGRVYTCCAPCNKKIRADQAGTYKLSYPKTEKAGNTVCPVTAKPIGESSVTVVLQGREIALCCKDCIAPARADAQATLALAMNPKLIDLKNTLDPANGKPVAKNLVVMISGYLVRLSVAESIEDVKKDPALALERAKASVAGTGTASRPTGDQRKNG